MTRTPPSPTLIDATQYGRLSTVARELGVGVSTLDSAVRSGYVETVRIFGGDTLISVESARRWQRDKVKRTPGPKPKAATQD